MSWYISKEVSFRRMDGRIEPVCVSEIPKGTVVFYEVPVKSEDHFTVDIVQYTMQCVYTGEILFPCAFNTDISSKSLKNTRSKVFFDQVFEKKFRRNLTDRLATAFMDTCRKPYLFKALGAFSESEESKEFNCLRVSFPNGESFLVTVRDLEVSEVLVRSSKNIKIPDPDSGFRQQFEVMNLTLAEDIGLFSTAVASAKEALEVRPNVDVRVVKHAMDPGLYEKIRKYDVERQMGFTDIRERVLESGSESTGEQDESEMRKKMEDKYNELMGEHFGDEFM